MTADKSSSGGDYLGQIWSLCTTLTEEAMAAAVAKCTELKFDPDRGVVPLQETFINLSAARMLLEDAIEEQKLIQLPITVQKEILTNLQTISQAIQGLTAGTDEVVNITNSVEALNTSIWKYGLHNLSGEVLGYQKKLNQIKILEVRLSQAATKLQTAQIAAEQAATAANEIGQKNTDASTTLEQLKQSGATASTLLEQIRDAETKTSILHSTIQQEEKQSGELASGIKTASNELLSLDASIRKFYGEVEDYRRKINETTEEASDLIRRSEAGVKGLVDDATTKADEAIESLQQTQNKVTEELKETIEALSSKATGDLAKTTEMAQSSIKAVREDALAQSETLSETFKVQFLRLKAMRGTKSMS